MPDGGTITLSLSTEPRLGGAVVHADITDTGSGVPEAIRGQVFDSFLSGRPDGTGLGLAVSNALIEIQGGKLSIESEVGIGTSVYFTLPFARA